NLLANCSIINKNDCFAKKLQIFKGDDYMRTHEAPGQMAGYLYQVLAALLVLVDGKNGNNQICIEKFDDIAFVDKDDPKILIQTKHQIGKKGSLIDSSADLWRSIKSWCDTIKQLKKDYATTKFIIITTAQAEEDSVAFLLKANNRNPEKALKILLEIAKAHEQVTNKKFYDTFLSLEPQYQKQLVDNMFVFDNSFHILEARDELKSKLRYATLPQHEDAICERLEGWWFKKAIECLCSKEIVLIHQRQIQTLVFEIASEYRKDSLPIDVDYTASPNDVEWDSLNQSNKLFIEQLNLIMLSDARVKRAIRDYYHAYQQRARWVREELLYVDELESYEVRLVDEWHRLFLIMKETLEDDGISNEDDKAKRGRAFFSTIENLDLHIRERVTQPFVMRGTFHGLSNDLRVGWHIDFYQRLCSLFEGGLI
ncbi:MAG: hypothetical protein RR413_09865, partial [Christensenellaceae bacterium]